MGWLSKTVPSEGFVVYATPTPPRAEDFVFLKRQGFGVARTQPPADAQWALVVQRDDCGKAMLYAPRDPIAPPGEWIECDARLSDDEKQRAMTGKSGVRLVVKPSGSNILREKKRFLRFLRAALGDKGVVAADVNAMRLWSSAALDDELSHDADPDIEALYTLHVIGDASGERPAWMHTHGLAEIGFWDFDILQPSEDLFTVGVDAVRAIAYAIVEGEVTIGGPAWGLAEPGGDVRFVDVAEFMSKADPRFAALRSGAEEHHTNDRAVVCDPIGKFARLFGGKPVPSKFLSAGFGEEGLISFSEEASRQMAERARGTYAMFRKLAQEFAEFEFNCVAKISYEIDGGSGELEHLWFAVHAFGDDHLDATLSNQPFRIARMQQGQRGKHPLTRLADWVIITPAGMINPRNTAPARMIREHREELLAVKRKHESSGRADTGSIPLED